MTEKVKENGRALRGRSLFVSSTPLGHELTNVVLSGTLIFAMSQDRLIKLVSEGDEQGTGKGHVIYTTKNRRKLSETKFEFRKFNPIARKHTIYKEKKK